MLIFQLYGGLGNQLFEYAFARSLSHDLDEELFLDISKYCFNVSISHIIYGLHPYNIKGAVGYYPSSTYIENRVYKGKLNIYEIGGPLTQWGWFKEGLIEKNIQKIKFPAYFTGYYSAGLDENNKGVITEKFFIHNEKIIREDLTYLPEISDEFKELAQEIKNCNSVAIHIRRGEYKDLEHFGTCSIEYYQNAIDEISSRVENPKFFVFTEDHEWVKNNIDIPFPYKHIHFERKKHSPAGGYAELLKILSLCKHFIIANSTFSWWGSWLSENKNKIIIAPTPWFQNRTMLYPDTISNKKPILIENNKKAIFENSDNILFNFNNKENNKLPNSQIKIPKLDKKDNEKLMIKLSMKTNSRDKVTIFYKSQQTKLKYYQVSEKELKTFEKPYEINYYANDEFEHYVSLPTNVDLDSIAIKFANNEKSEYLLKTLEIRTIPSDNNDENDWETIYNGDEDYVQKIKFNKLNNLITDPQLSFLSKFFKARVDLKNIGDPNNELNVIRSDDIYWSSPDWWVDEKGKGIIARSTAGSMNFRVKCNEDGLLNIFLRSEDIKNNQGVRIPIYLRYTKFKVNNKNIITDPQDVHHDKPFFYKKDVKKDEEIEIYIEWTAI